MNALADLNRLAARAFPSQPVCAETQVDQWGGRYVVVYLDLEPYPDLLTLHGRDEEALIADAALCLRALAEARERARGTLQ